MSNGTQELPAEAPDTLLPLNDRSAARLWKALRDLEALIPSDPAFERFIADQRPAVLLVTPLVSLGGRQTEFVKAARTLGVPSALLVFSWDNLSNKGVIHTIPDRVFVWNEVQREEATKLHRVPAAAVVATGAPRFDLFFRMAPSLDRAAFCETAGLDPARPLVVYLASSPAADAVVGLNTSAEIEAGILGKPVYTIRAPDVAPGQTGSTHFQYLLESQGGFVHDAATLEQHVEQLGEGLAGRFSAERLQTFVHGFVRPRGLEVPASRVLAEEIVAFVAHARQGSRLRRV